MLLENTFMKNLAVTVQNSSYSATFKFMSNISQEIIQTKQQLIKLAMLFTVTTVIFNNRQFYKEYLMIAITDIATNSNMQQRIATVKSSLCFTKFYIVLQNIFNNNIDTLKNNYSKKQLILFQVSYSKTSCEQQQIHQICNNVLHNFKQLISISLVPLGTRLS